MNRTKINYVTDTLAFVGFLFLISTGMLLRYLLPPGSGGSHDANLGQRVHDKAVHVVWGWSRHDWGDLHYYVALGVMTILVVHLLLHWKWIFYTTRGKNSEASGHRLTLGIGGLLGVVALALTPMFAPVEKVPRGALQKNNTEITTEHEEHVIRGDMNLQEITEQTEVPLSNLIEKLGLPADVSLTDNVGRLRRQYDFTMQDLREVLAEHEGKE